MCLKFNTYAPDASLAVTAGLDIANVFTSQLLSIFKSPLPELSTFISYNLKL